MAKPARRQSLLHGATILVAATALVKVIGAVFRIPLGNIIGSIGLSYYQTAYDLYLPIYSLAMAGLPVAVSRLVSESAAQGRFRDVRVYRRFARRLFLASGVLGTFVMCVIAYPYVHAAENPDSLPAVLLTAPSLLFCCAMASYRGYYEGLRNMYPTAVSSVIEALGKLVIGLAGSYSVIRIGMNEFRASGTVFGRVPAAMENSAPEEVAYLMTLPYAAAAAIAGVTLGSALGALYMSVRFRRGGDGITREMLCASPAPGNRKHYLVSIISISVPIVIGSLAQNIAGLVDSVQVQRQLQSVVQGNLPYILSVYGEHIPEGANVREIAYFLYGCYKGNAFAVYNLVPTLTSVLGVSALPAMAGAWAKRDKRAVRANLETVMRVTALFVLPAGLGLAVLSQPILGLLYRNPGSVAVAAPTLSILGFTAIFAGMNMPVTNMLQAVGRQNVPVRNMIIGVVLKIVVNFFLVRIPEVNILGAPVGTLVCYFFLFVTNTAALLRHTRVRPDLVSVALKPLFAAVLCGAAAWASYRPLASLLEEHVRFAAVGAILAGGIVYLAALVLLKAFCREDILTLPSGEKIAAKLAKWRVID